MFIRNRCLKNRENLPLKYAWWLNKVAIYASVQTKLALHNTWHLSATTEYMQPLRESWETWWRHQWRVRKEQNIWQNSPGKIFKNLERPFCEDPKKECHLILDHFYFGWKTLPGLNGFVSLFIFAKMFECKIRNLCVCVFIDYAKTLSLCVCSNWPTFCMYILTVLAWALTTQTRPRLA